MWGHKPRGKSTQVHLTVKVSALLILAMQVTAISQLAAKPMANWGKVYDVTLNGAIGIPPPADDVRGYLQTYIEKVRQDAKENTRNGLWGHKLRGK